MGVTVVSCIGLVKNEPSHCVPLGGNVPANCIDGTAVLVEIFLGGSFEGINDRTVGTFE